MVERIHLCERNDAHKLVEERATWLDGDISGKSLGRRNIYQRYRRISYAKIAEVAIQIRGEGGERQFQMLMWAGCHCRGDIIPREY